ncbi:hypothetical protein EXE48_04005 [Halorubrum sp. ASP1]|jgi:hypothetical protein|uniref:hypothetical protein n=1 Tax=unclassified Halorubrum TaxID=2642239 RepID=UPI0010F491D1|nr:MULTISPECIES: hypothetical protein [unclassified Halorubrum]TKX49065.1 hypothetical protein EXE49_13420 [Halorubrum sp. ASP121]TKX62939.1 hypothetical protein EXE48_04005 [Halorubrum sp. ASP1]
MTLLFDLARVAAGVNVVLLLVLISVWGRNYLELRSKHALGLLLFAALLLGENGIALYYYVVDPTLSAWFDTQVPVIVWRVMLLFHVLETLAIGFLTWITLD